MKVTKQIIEQFERDQRERGTQAALYNLIWEAAADRDQREQSAMYNLIWEIAAEL
jgi:hypothetical protein